GRVAIGLGLMLLSLRLLSEATEPLRNSPAFLAALEGMQNEYVIAVLFGALATWAVHSSLSTVLLVMSFAASGIVHPPMALALVFLPLIDPLAKLCRRLLPDRLVADDPARPRHLDPHVLDTPAEALACAMRETLYLGDRVGDMLRDTMDVFERNDEKGMRTIA